MISVRDGVGANATATAYNNLTGSIPTEFGRLTKMVSYANLDSCLSAFFLWLRCCIVLVPEIQADLSFGNNRLTGTIPTELGALENLWFLSLSTLCLVRFSQSFLSSGMRFVSNSPTCTFRIFPALLVHFAT